MLSTKDLKALAWIQEHNGQVKFEYGYIRFNEDGSIDRHGACPQQNYVTVRIGLLHEAEAKTISEATLLIQQKYYGSKWEEMKTEIYDEKNSYFIKETSQGVIKGHNVMNIDSVYDTITAEYTDGRSGKFAVVVVMSVQTSHNFMKKRLIVPNVSTPEEAYKKAEKEYYLRGDLGYDVGVSLFDANVPFVLPNSSDTCDVRF